MLETGLRRVTLDAGQSVEEPLANDPKPHMGAGPHFPPCIFAPPLTYGGIAILHHLAPTWGIGLVHHQVNQVRPVAGQEIPQQIVRAAVAGGGMPLGDHANVVLQGTKYGVSFLLGRHLRQQGFRQVGHVVQAVVGGGFLIVVGVEQVPMRFGLRTIPCGLLTIAKHFQSFAEAVQVDDVHAVGLDDLSLGIEPFPVNHRIPVGQKIPLAHIDQSGPLVEKRLRGAR